MINRPSFRPRTLLFPRVRMLLPPAASKPWNHTRPIGDCSMGLKVLLAPCSHLPKILRHPGRLDLNLVQLVVGIDPPSLAGMDANPKPMKPTSENGKYSRRCSLIDIIKSFSQ